MGNGEEKKKEGGNRRSVRTKAGRNFGGVSHVSQPPAVAPHLLEDAHFRAESN